ncbi:aspartic proteinase NANA, chloroplast-like [Silene latifolia]|uniref:aspartic proteinase NANA, chloroplast-like n=1 Tax=Silene latifolia TaxID=37657 RepID=UPI003D76E52E
MFLKSMQKFSILIIVIISLICNNDNSVLGYSSSSRHKGLIKKDKARHEGIKERSKWRSSLPKASRRLMEDEEDDIPIGEREGPLKSTINGSVKLPMYAAAEYHMGQYLVEIEIGTPPTKLRMIADTGSDLTWVKCKDGGETNLTNKRAFDATKSSTFKSFGCGNALCQEDFKMLRSLDLCPTIDAPCFYNYSYGDEGLITFGKFSKDAITLPTTTGESVNLQNMLIGCSSSVTGKANINEADGILGLGMHPFSFAIHGVSKFGGIFSYCLVDHLSPHNVTNYLIFGDEREKCPTQEFMRYTVLKISEDSAFYWIYIKGISIGKEMLDINRVVWDTTKEDGGTILDSGTSATYWLEPAYRAIMDVLIKALEKDFPKLPNWKGDGMNDFEYCFKANSTLFKKFNVPRFEIHFKDGARFKPHVKSYIIDDSPGVKCIGFLQAQGGVNIIGNILQQNYLWEFDVHHETMGFAASTCG